MKIPQLDELQTILNQPRKIGVIPHQNPDGDALGSCLAWASFLEKKKTFSHNYFSKRLS